MSEASPSPSAQLILEEREAAVVTLRLNRPDCLNALNVPLGMALVEALRRVAADESVRAVVLTGAGRGFCAGGDVNLLRDARMRRAAHELEALVSSGKHISLLIATMKKPAIASVNGPAAGGGMNLALSCDFRIASEQAVFAESFRNLGLHPDFGGTYFLPRLVGPARAAELFYTGEIMSAAEALRIGIVNKVVPTDRLAEETRALAKRLADGPPIAARAVKQLLFDSDHANLERALDEEIRQQTECFMSEDCAEGLQAFFEKRPPKFKGK